MLGIAQAMCVVPGKYYCIRPISIKFLRFTESGLHISELYSRVEDGWIKSYLQP